MEYGWKPMKFIYCSNSQHKIIQKLLEIQDAQLKQMEDEMSVSLFGRTQKEAEEDFRKSSFPKKRTHFNFDC